MGTTVRAIIESWDAAGVGLRGRLAGPEFRNAGARLAGSIVCEQLMQGERLVREPVPQDRVPQGVFPNWLASVVSQSMHTPGRVTQDLPTFGPLWAPEHGSCPAAESYFDEWLVSLRDGSVPEGAIIVGEQGQPIAICKRKPDMPYSGVGAPTTVLLEPARLQIEDKGGDGTAQDVPRSIVFDAGTLVYARFRIPVYESADRLSIVQANQVAGMYALRLSGMAFVEGEPDSLPDYMRGIDKQYFPTHGLAEAREIARQYLSSVVGVQA